MREMATGMAGNVDDDGDIDGNGNGNGNGNASKAYRRGNPTIR